MEKFKRLLKEYVSVTIGALCIAVAVHTFVLPYTFVPGGASGLAVLFEAIGLMRTSVGIVVVNAPLLVLAVFKLNKEFAIKTVVATFETSGFKALFDAGFFQFETNILLSAIMAGALYGLSMGIMFNANSSNGGSEIAARVIQRAKPEMNVSKLIMAIDMTTMVLAAFYFRDVWSLAYSLIMSYVCSVAMELYINGIDHAVNFRVITDKPMELYNSVAPRFKRGCTMIPVVGHVEGKSENKTMLIFVVQYRQLGFFRRSLEKIDPDAFAFAVETNDILRERFNAKYR